jgi:CRISPR-associated exonuclease Cas4
MKDRSNYRGIDISYVCICLRRAWLSLHEIYITDGTEYVKLGAYANNIERNYGYSQVTIGRNKLDFVQFTKEGKCVIHEFKRGRKLIEADKFQIAHYINVANANGFSVDHGEIHLLGSKKVITVKFPLENLDELNEKYEILDRLRNSQIPKAKRCYFCFRGCSYVEFCWGAS